MGVVKASSTLQPSFKRPFTLSHGMEWVRQASALLSYSTPDTTIGVRFDTGGTTKFGAGSKPAACSLVQPVFRREAIVVSGKPKWREAAAKLGNQIPFISIGWRTEFSPLLDVRLSSEPVPKSALPIDKIVFVSRIVAADLVRFLATKCGSKVTFCRAAFLAIARTSRLWEQR